MKKHYEDAVAFLLERVPDKHPEKVLAEYVGGVNILETAAIADLYERLLRSAQNANMKAGVIGDSIDGFENLGRALFGFDPKRVSINFSGTPDLLLSHIQTTLKPRGQVRTGNKSIWPKYCKTILSSAAFLNQFKDADDFRSWANHLYSDERSIDALPLLLSSKVEGIGYALACDFLKELGFTKYGKPDVHVSDIFIGLGLCPAGANPHKIQDVISAIAADAKVSSYDVDKVFWLVGSGKFYKHPHLGKKGRIGRMKEAFVALHAPPTPSIERTGRVSTLPP